MGRTTELLLGTGAVLATMVTAAPTAAAPAPAVAAAAAPAGCRDNGGREIDTPFFNTDLNNVAVCIEQAPTGEYRATVTGFYTDGGDGSRKFDRLAVTVRIEQGSDIQVAANTCEKTREVNATPNGSLQCSVEGVPVGGGPITADGFITYDIEADGGGDLHWRLHGSPPDE
ncbi:hypothetical protein [Pseudonocardia humida]|uniref:Secreted protein n=1 Tax=Pseudonocardia humida TaxID=2800819 RepID=A0ABT1A0K1_9PSEU|nr:hypothetical protein [Pseudonocardia humida]MCO1656536.1 hypothetical protein [Pseudonocardia humida]